MANLTKRIIDLQTTSTLGSDDYVMVDGATNGTKKYLLKDILDEIEDIKEGTALATGAVTTDKLAAGAVTNAKIGDGAVDTTNIADDAITAAKIDDGAVGTNALAANAVTGAKIATGAVGTGNIASGAVTLAKIASDSNATSSRNGLMSSTDKAKLDGFSAASNYALKSDIVGAYIFKGSVNTENDLPSTGLTVGDVYNIIAASSYGESGANVAWTGTAWDALGESFDISDGAIDTEQLANGAVTNDKLADEAKTTISPTINAYTDPTYGSGTRQGYDATFGNSGLTIMLPKVSSSLLIDVENIPTIPEKKIGAGAITANKIAAGAVSTEKLVNSAVNTDKLATAAVSTDKIASLAVTTNKIAAGAVDNSKLANNAVGTAQIANGAVTSEKLSSDITSAIDSKAAASAVTALSARVDEELETKADIDAITHGHYPSLSVGRADALTGADETTQWTQRVSTGNGAATVRSVQGNTVVWNQMAPTSKSAQVTEGITLTVSDGTVTVSGTATGSDTTTSRGTVTVDAIVGHKYLGALRSVSAGSSNTGGITIADGFNTMIGGYVTTDASAIFTASANKIRLMTSTTKSGVVFDITAKFQLFDLTLMFGAGNEPATVEEFEAMYPLPYYPYSAPTLKPVQIAGIKSVGFNQWDEEWENGLVNASGGLVNSNAYIRSKNYILCMPNTAYYCTRPRSGFYVAFYDQSKNFISRETYSTGTGTLFNTLPNSMYMKFCMGGTGYEIGYYNNDVCINISDPARNGEYKPYMSDAIEWTAQTLRAAGSVADMLYSDHVDVRVGVVDLGTLTWSSASGSRFKAALPEAKTPANDNTEANLKCAHYVTVSANNTASGTDGIAVTVSGNVVVYDADYAGGTVSAFKTAMDGVLLFYELATPTTTPINPALPMTYCVEQGGSEAIIVPDGEISAPPVLTVAEGESVADVVMDALACIATPDGPVATTNHAINTYLTMQGKLYKVTSAIAVGESIVAGTNVTETTVMAELIARTA